MTDKTEFAFPSEYYVPEIFAQRREALGIHEARKEATGVSPGMTLRDWFAGQALSGMLHSGFTPSGKYEPFDFDFAKAAYVAADAMLAARK